MERLTRFEKFVILERLGEDGAGTCYRVAPGAGGEAFGHLRVFSPNVSSEAVASQVRRAVLIASQFDHPNLVRPLATGTVDDALYLHREFVGGTNLADVLARCKREMYPLGVDHIIFVVTSVLAALEYLHGKKVEGRRLTHAGLCPVTVKVTYEGDVRLSDWELHEAMPAEISRALMGTGAVAPEVRKGEEATSRSSVFSVGAMLLEILARKAVGPDLADARALVSALNLKNLASPAAGDRFREILNHCLAPDAAARFEDVREVRAALDELVAAEGIDVSHFNFALFMHTLFRAETEEEGEKLDTDRNLRELRDGGAPVAAVADDDADETLYAAPPAPDRGAELPQDEVRDEDETVVADGPLADLYRSAAKGPRPSEERAASRAEMVAVMGGDPSAVESEVADDRTVTLPEPFVPPPPAAPRPAPPRPAPPPAPRPSVAAQLPGDDEPAPAGKRKGGFGAKHVVLLVVVLLVLVMVAAGVLLLRRKPAEVETVAESTGGVSSPSPVLPPPDGGVTPTEPAEGVPPTTAPPTPVPTPSVPAGTPTPEEAPTPAVTPPATPEPTVAPPPVAVERDLAAARSEIDQLVKKGKFDDARARIDALAKQQPDLAAPLEGLRQDVKTQEDKKLAADRAKAAAEEKEREEAAAAEQQAEAIATAATAVEQALAAGKPEEARTLLDGNADLAASDAGAKLRARIEAELARPRVNEGDLVDLSAGGVVAPRVKSRVEPKYPPIARRQRVRGEVLVEALVDENGVVVETRVKSATSTPSGNWGFEHASEEAAKRCAFFPATKEGVKVKMWLSIPFTFIP